jgi:peptidoglycan/LPS O-acetylase OafA/YrhL
MRKIWTIFCKDLNNMASNDLKYSRGSQSEYLDHINGLRFVAVTLVLLFHLRIRGFSGGFVGVDIFFVISGFLMTRIILAMPLDKAGIFDFFLRRFRRIVPAYVVLVAVTSIVASIVFLPVQLNRVASSMAACAGFLSNFVFFRTIDYFSPVATFNPLLHTWSLAVEWQFYLVYPFLLIISRRLKLKDGFTITAIGLISFILCAVLIHRGKVIPSFYMLPTRIWEFTLGGLLVFFADRKIPGAMLKILPYFALAAIAYCTVHYDESTPFPGIAALLPCVATAILIYAGGTRGPVNTFLNCSPVQLLGQSSYSIYLWHWPVIVFLNYGFIPFIRDMPVLRMISILLLSLILGLLSWRFVEIPFRKASSYSGGKRIAWLSALAAVPLVLAGGVRLSDGFPQRFQSEVIAVSSASLDTGDFRTCLTRRPAANGKFDDLCKLGVDSGSSSFLLLGDSHAAALADGLSRMAAQHKKSGTLSVSDACVPFLSFPGGYLPEIKECEATQRIIPGLLDTLKPDTVILHAAWSDYYQSDPKNFRAALESTLDLLASKKVHVYIIDDTPGALQNVPIGLAKQIAFNLTFDLLKTDDYRRSHEAVGTLLKSEADRHGFTYINLTDVICKTGGYCEVALQDRPLYWDNTHLSGFGSRIVAGDIDRNIRIDY